MDIGNFCNSLSNDRCDYIFYLKKVYWSLPMFSATLLSPVFLVNFLVTIFTYSLREKYISLIFTWDVYFIWLIYICTFRTFGIVNVFLQLSVDIELNQGPTMRSCKSVLVCHGDLNSISSHNFIKVSPLTACNALQKFDVICISETYLNSDTPLNDENLIIPVYRLLISSVI